MAGTGDSEWFFLHAPEAIVLLNSNLTIDKANQRFNKTVGPTSILKGNDKCFLAACVHAEEQTRFKLAIDYANQIQKKNSSETPQGPSSDVGSDLEEWNSIPVVRECNTLCLGHKGDYPIWRKLDWSIVTLADSKILLSARKSPAESIPNPEAVDSSRAPNSPPSERELLDFLNKAPIAMHWLSGTGHVLWANETEMNTLGYSPEEYIGQPIMDFCPDEKELVLEIFKSLGSGNAIKDVPVRFRAKNGDIKYLLIDSNVNWNPDGSFKHTRCFIRDDTERRVREERLRVGQMKAKELSVAKDAFLRKIFHEIRTPSHLMQAGITELAEYLAEKEDTKGEEMVNVLRFESRKLQGIADDAADASLFHQGKLPCLKPTEFSLEKFMADICLDVSTLVGVPEGVKCTLSLGRSSPAYPWDQLTGDLKGSLQPDRVNGDGKILGRVLTHLIGNALRVTKAGRVEVGVVFWPPQPGQAGRYTFKVNDTGGGVDIKWCNQRFHTYFDTYSSDAGGHMDPAVGTFSDLRKDKEGMGLGLFVCYNFVQVLGGTLGVASSQNGTEFSFTIPLPPASNIMKGPSMQAQPTAASAQAQFTQLELGFGEDTTLEDLTFEQKDFGISSTTFDRAESWMDLTPSNLLSFDNLQSHVARSDQASTKHDQGDPKKDPPPVGIEAERLRQPNVLLVDNNAIVQKLGSKLLGALDCNVEVANNGEQAMKQMLTSGDKYYEVAFVSLQMPVMDGMQFLKAMRKDPMLGSIPVIALKDKKDEIEDEDLKNMGFFSVISKPVSKPALAAALEASKGFACKAQSSKAATAATTIVRESSTVSDMSDATAEKRESWTALVVDDNNVCLRVARVMMEKLGFKVQTAVNGLEATQILKEHSGFKMVLMDLRMPVMDGIEATQLIRTDLGLKQLPVIALTGELLSDGDLEDFNAVINKPADRSKIESEIKRIYPTWQPPPPKAKQPK